MLTILTGKSGSGKNAIREEMCNSGDWERFVTATTRPIDKDKFIEYYGCNTIVNGTSVTLYYGSPKQELDKNKDYVVILDPQGTKDFLKYYGKENCFVVSVEASDAIREERAIRRGSFNKAEWDNRLVEDNAKFSEEFIRDFITFRVKNVGNIDKALYNIDNALAAYYMALPSIENN